MIHTNRHTNSMDRAYIYLIEASRVAEQMGCCCWGSVEPERRLEDPVAGLVAAAECSQWPSSTHLNGKSS